MAKSTRLDPDLHDPAAGDASDGSAAPPDRAARGLAPRRLLRWAPVAVVTALSVALLARHGVRLADVTVFGGYLVFCLGLPGTLLVRAACARARTRAEEAALGLALGYAAELACYLPARAFGVPLLVLAWPAVTYGAFLAVPRLRRYWRAGPRMVVAPTWWAWWLALVVSGVVIWSAVTFFASQRLGWPVLGKSYPDLPFHLALVGELRYHVPPTVPMVAGEPLVYHWFVHAHLAAASHVTGVEPVVLLYRLGPLPMMAALAVLLAMTARRLLRSWPGAAVAVTLALFVLAPVLYMGPAMGAFDWSSAQSWLSPSQTFGALLFAPVVLLVADLLERRRPAGEWLLLAVFLLAVMGAKATYLPLLAAGLVAVAAVEAIGRRRVPRRVLPVLGMTVTCLVFAQVVLFGGARQGMVVDPLSLSRITWAELTGADAETAAPVASVLGVTMLCVLGGVVAWSGVLGLLSRPRLLLRPWVVLVLAMAVAGAGMALLFAQPGRSQVYFLQGACPYLAMAAVHGLLVVTRRAGLSARDVVRAAGAGAVIALLVRALCGVTVPLEPGRSEGALYLPYLALVATVATAATVLAALRWNPLRISAVTLVIVTAAGTPGAWSAHVLPWADPAPSSPTRQAARSAARPRPVPAGLVGAARWLRSRSAPSDLVATGMHCRVRGGGMCDHRAAWVAALTERRVLVEGWTYTARNLDRWRPGEVAWRRRFWDRDRLRVNDAVFEAPSAASVAALRDRYGVRWLLADERRAGRGAALGRHAVLRHRSGDFSVYEIPPAGGRQVGETTLNGWQ
ncbi:hypothetical protein [Nonomuraea sp. NPDC005501]|uniref:hypothetical protein n=1 Tax=Nonomuraea sp. NPDC005501 TaxID=3156884 RepID=UPI0033A3DA9F